MRRFFCCQKGGMFLIIGLIGLSCAAQRAAIWGDATSGYRLSYRSRVGDIFVYERILSGTDATEHMGQLFEATSSSKYVFQLQSERSDSLLSFVLTVDTIRYSFDGPRGTQTIDFGDIQGKKVRVTITPTGEAREIVPIDSLPMPKIGDQPIGGDSKGWLAVQFFNVPKKPIKIGEQWTETKLDTITHTDTTRQSSQISINKSQSTYTVLGEEMKMGFRCLHLLVETTRSLQSSEKAKDNETNSEGEGETKSEAWFAYNEGMLVAFDSSDFYEGTTAYSGSRNMTSANTTESKLSLRLIKYQPAHK